MIDDGRRWVYIAVPRRQDCSLAGNKIVAMLPTWMVPAADPIVAQAVIHNIVPPPPGAHWSEVVRALYDTRTARWIEPIDFVTLYDVPGCELPPSELP